MKFNIQLVRFFDGLITFELANKDQSKTTLITLIVISFITTLLSYLFYSVISIWAINHVFETHVDYTFIKIVMIAILIRLVRGSSK